MRRELAAALRLLLLSACGGNDDSTAPRAAPCSSPVEAPDTRAVPRELDLAEHATITRVTRRGAAIGVSAVSELSVVELYPPLARAILDAGYSIVSSDNEGFEAEIFFGDDKTTGAYRLREAGCEGQVVVKLLFEQQGGRGKT